MDTVVRSRAVKFFPRRRPIDQAFLDLAEGAHARLAMPARRARPSSDTPSRYLLLLVVAAAATVGSGGVVAAMVAPAGAPPSDPARSCSPVRYVVDLTDAPPGSIEMVAEAFGRIGDSTGLTFVFAGPPVGAAPSAGSAVAMAQPVLVAWTRGAALSVMANRPDPLGYTRVQRNRNGELRTGSVFLANDVALPDGFGDRRTQGGVLLHELGHLVGLPHSPNPSDLMYPEVIDGPLAWSPAEHAALRTLGHKAGCEPRL